MKPVTATGFTIFDIDRRFDLADFGVKYEQLKSRVMPVQFKSSIDEDEFFELFCPGFHLITDTVYVCCKMSELIIGIRAFFRIKMLLSLPVSGKK